MKKICLSAVEPIILILESVSLVILCFKQSRSRSTRLAFGDRFFNVTSNMRMSICDHVFFVEISNILIVAAFDEILRLN